jgi:hypothetical protein
MEAHGIEETTVIGIGTIPSAAMIADSDPDHGHLQANGATGEIEIGTTIETDAEATKMHETKQMVAITNERGGQIEKKTGRETGAGVKMVMRNTQYQKANPVAVIHGAPYHHNEVL